MTVIDSDYEGPVPSVPVTHTDYYLYMSWLVIIIAFIHTCIKCQDYVTPVYDKVANLFNFDHHHQD